MHYSRAIGCVVLLIAPCSCLGEEPKKESSEKPDKKRYEAYCRTIKESHYRNYDEQIKECSIELREATKEVQEWKKRQRAGEQIGIDLGLLTRPAALQRELKALKKERAKWKPPVIELVSLDVGTMGSISGFLVSHDSDIEVRQGAIQEFIVLDIISNTEMKVLAPAITPDANPKGLPGEKLEDGQDEADHSSRDKTLTDSEHGLDQIGISLQSVVSRQPASVKAITSKCRKV